MISEYLVERQPFKLVAEGSSPSSGEGVNLRKANAFHILMPAEVVVLVVVNVVRDAYFFYAIASDDPKSRTDVQVKYARAERTINLIITRLA